MNITDIQEYVIREKPAAAYLGRREMEAMLTEARASGWTEPEPEPEPYRAYNTLPRLEYCGCPIFEVIAESHAGFSSHNVPALAQSGGEKTSTKESNS